MKIKITEKQLGYIINSKFNEINCNNNLNRFLENTSFSKNDLFVDYGKNIICASITNPMSCYCIHEGINMTYPIEMTVEFAKKTFGLCDEQIVVGENFNGIKCIIVTIPTISDNLKRVVKAFNTCGYFLSYPKREKIPQNEWVTLQFEPIHQKEVGDVIRKEENFLYHITPSRNFNKIKHIGLSPRTKNDVFDYPDRVYYIRGSLGLNKTLLLGYTLYQSVESEKKDGNYSILKINLNELPEYIEFYYDSNFEYGVYSLNNIHPSLITMVEEINYEEFEKRLKNENK